MPLTKDLLRDCLAATPDDQGNPIGQDAVVWTTVCDTYASAKFNPPRDATASHMQAIADRAHRLAHGCAKGQGTKLDAFILEFVDHAGTVVHTARFGAMKPPAPAPHPQPAGHTPIAGLRQHPTPQQHAGPLPGVKNVIAVGAGKGGVGKSTVAVAIAVGLARRGYDVGLLDADIYGPSMPTMLGLHEHQPVLHDGLLEPFFAHGIKCMTIGKLVEADKPLIWRGPMAHGAFKQLTEQTAWGELDYLIVDLPPGTGDISLTMAQTLQLAGAVVVCTPQQVAQDDASRAARMFQQLGIDVLGVVENMSSFVGDDGKTYDIFGRGGAQHMAQRLGLPYLGDIPITMPLRINSDAGNPTANFTDTSPAGKRLAGALEKLLNTFEGQVALAANKRGSAKPTLTVS
jgi:ATP-binding protein involved in chromosome partitioning